MPKIILIALTCFVFLTGCQSAPETETQAAAPAAVETPAATPETPADTVAAPEVSTPAASESQAGEQETAPVAESAGESNMELKTALAHHNFVLETVDGQEFTYPVPEGAEMVKPNLSFGEWPHASGKVCNNFRGQVELDGDTLLMKNAASTMMLCFAEEVNKLEGLFHQMLRDGVKVTVEGQTLTLTGGGHVLVFKLRDYVS